MEHNYHMYYDNPAKIWGNALPLGNGRLGAMVYGETDMERMVLPWIAIIRHTGKNYRKSAD